MPRLTGSVVDSFIDRVNRLDRTRLKMEALLSSNQIGLDDIDQVYAGLFTGLFAHFEAAIEDLFLGLLSGDLSSSKYAVSLTVTIFPTNMTRQVVFGFRNYLDWLPYDQMTASRANNYFHNGEPFSLLGKPHRDNLDDYGIIRNALAHTSSFSYSKFQNEITKGLTLLPYQKSPAGYLRSMPSAATGQTQYQMAALELVAILRALC